MMTHEIYKIEIINNCILSYLFQVLRWWHDFGLTLCASVFATLAFESPILGIEKAIFGRGAAPAPKKVEPTSAPAPPAAPAVTAEATTSAEPTKA